MKILKKFEKFKSIYEAHNPLDSDYLKDIDKRAEEEVGREGDINHREVMRYVEEIHQIQDKDDNLDKLRDLAEKVIKSEYGFILDGVNLDMKIFKSGDVNKNNMKYKTKQLPTPMIELDVSKIKDEIDKRKIVNIITQGAAKNAHRLIHSDISRDGLNDIDPRLLKLFDKLIKSNEFMEWKIPKSMASKLMKENPSGISEVSWEDSEEISKKDKTTTEILDEIGNNSGNDDADFDFSEGGPKITAIGIDYVILLHETVKGIYELIAQVALPEEDIADDVLLATDTTDDEYDDLKYGVYIRRDLVSFIIDNPKISEIKNGIEFVFGGVQPNVKGLYDVPSKNGEFKELIIGMINGTKEARNKVDMIIDNVVNFFKNWDNGEPIITELDITKNIDYSKMSKSELSKYMDNALDNNDMELAREIGKYL